MIDRNFRVTFSYDGTDFCGWQIQASERTVQGEVERALGQLHDGRAIRVHAAGRTDSGVHATGQVASFTTPSSIPTESFARALNSRLPRDVRAVVCSEAPSEFHARYSARSREYKYYIEPSEFSDPFSRRFALTVKNCPPIHRLNRCAGTIVGTHDFSAFSAAGDQNKSKVRTVHAASFSPEGRFLVFRIVANAFLWKMVRSLVGTIIEVAAQPGTAALFSDILASRDRAKAGPTAAAKGLVLSRVYYET